MKKVASILKNAREEKGLSFDKISKELMIHPKFLKALEEGNYKVFADTVHIRGFLKNYAEFLGLDVSQILAFWRREYEASARPVPIRDVTRPIKAPQFVITPGVVVAGLTFLLVTAFLAYLFWQYRSIAGPPALKVISPQKDMVVSDPKILIEGFTDPDATLEISGLKISLDANGRFSWEHVLSPGTNVLNFVATNKFGRETKLVRRLVYEEPERRFAPPREALREASPSVLPRVGPEATKSAAP